MGGWSRCELSASRPCCSSLRNGATRQTILLFYESEFGFQTLFFFFHRFPYFILSFLCQVERVGCGTEVLFPKKCISDWALLLCLLVSWFRERSFDKDLDQLPWHLGLYFRHNPYRLQYSHWPSAGTEKYLKISKDDGDFLITSFVSRPSTCTLPA